MQITQIKGKKWTIGLDWEVLAGEASIKQESREVAEKTNCNYGILVEYDGKYALGLSQKPSKYPSASLYLALANQQARASDALDNYPDWIVIEEAGEDKYWMAVIRNGLPAPLYDAVLDLTTIREKFTELMFNDTYKFYSTCGEIISLFEGTKYVEARGLNELTADIKVKVKHEKLRGIPNSVLYTGFALALLVMAGYGLSTFIEGRTLAQKTKTLRAKQEQQTRMEREQYEKELKNYEEQTAQLKQKARESVLLGLAGDPQRIISAWYNSVSSYPFGTHGWKLTNIECYYSPQGMSLNAPPVAGEDFACDYLFKRTGLTTNRMLLQDYPTAKISGNSALVVKSLQADKSMLNVPPESILATLPNANEWGFDMVSQLQLLKVVNVDYELRPSVDITYPGLTKPLSPEEKSQGKTPVAGKAESIGFSKGEIVVKNNNLEMLRELANNVDFKSVGGIKLKVSFGSQSSSEWELILNYYIKSDKGGVVGATSSDMSSQAVESLGGAADPGMPMPPGPGNPGYIPPQPSAASQAPAY